MDEKIKNKKVIIFDLDLTLTESKAPLDEEMASLLRALLDAKKVAVTSGGKFEQFEKQFLKNLSGRGEELENLYLIPTNAAELYLYDGKWSRVYSESLSSEEKRKIVNAFKTALASINFEKPEKIYGAQIEDRGAQITYSHFGQEAPVPLKRGWDPDHRKRERIRTALMDILPGFQVQIGGATSVDVTRRGMDKGYGIEKLAKHLNVTIADMLFIGDDLMEGGNDYPVRRTGIDWIEVEGPEETKEIIRSLLKK